MGRRVFSAEFKREAVKLAKQTGVSRNKVAKELGLHPNVLGRWVRLMESGKWNDTPGAPIAIQLDEFATAFSTM